MGISIELFWKREHVLTATCLKPHGNIVMQNDTHQIDD